MGYILDACKRFFESDDWPFEEHDELPMLKTGFKGSNGNYSCYFQERAAQDQLVFYSLCPLSVPEERRADVAEFINRANYGMVIGNFEMDYSDGEVRFKTSADVEGVELTPTFMKNILYANVVMIDRYFPGLMQVIYSGVAATEAIRQIEDPN